MAALIQFKRRIPGTGAPPTLAAGEPATTITAAGVADLYIGDGSAVRTLVSDTRQVELTGARTITGAKTIAVCRGSRRQAESQSEALRQRLLWRAISGSTRPLNS